jgi:hypothetical protein
MTLAGPSMAPLLTPLRAGAVVVLSHCPAPAQSPGICPGVLQCPAYTAGGDSRKPVTCGPPRYPPAKPRGALERNRRPRCVLTCTLFMVSLHPGYHDPLNSIHYHMPRIDDGAAPGGVLSSVSGQSDWMPILEGWSWEVPAQRRKPEPGPLLRGVSSDNLP